MIRVVDGNHDRIVLRVSVKISHCGHYTSTLKHMLLYKHGKPHTCLAVWITIVTALNGLSQTQDLLYMEEVFDSHQTTCGDG